MMSEMSTKVLIEEISSAIEGITSADSAKCQAHEPLARGVVVLLRVARVQMLISVRAVAYASLTSAIVSGVVTGSILTLRAVGWL